MKAFSVQETDERTGGIVFAKTNAQARRQGSSAYSDGDFHSVECYRAPWADRYALQGYVPTNAMIANGWHYECWHCGQYLPDEEADFEAATGNGHTAFCNELCEYDYHRTKLINKLADEAQRTLSTCYAPAIIARA